MPTLVNKAARPEPERGAQPIRSRKAFTHNAVSHCRRRTKLIDSLRRAFGATVGDKMETPDGKIGHADLKIGDSHLMLSGRDEDMKATPASLYLYVEDADALYRRALEAGASRSRSRRISSYGDRSACVKDLPADTLLARHAHRRCAEGRASAPLTRANEKMQRH